MELKEMVKKVVKRSKKTATPAPDLDTEDSSSLESSGAQVAAVRPTPENHPHLFDEFGNLK